MDKLNTYNNMTGLRRMITQIEQKKEKYASFHKISQDYLNELRLNNLKTSLNKNKARDFKNIVNEFYS